MIEADEVGRPLRGASRRLRHHYRHDVENIDAETYGQGRGGAVCLCWVVDHAIIME
jgi:hypothetical protein